MAKPILPTPPVTGRDADDLAASPKSADPKAAAVAAYNAAGAECFAITDAQLTRAVMETVQAAVAAEREACARLCEMRAQVASREFETAMREHDREGAAYSQGQRSALGDAAKRIRERGGEGR